MQGQYAGRPVTATVETSCGHCGEAMSIETDGDTFATAAAAAEPLVFAPAINLRKVGPNIIDGF